MQTWNPPVEMTTSAFRCNVTGNPVGTDTMLAGRPCACQGCRSAVRINELEDALKPFAAALAKSAYRADVEDEWTISYAVPITVGDLRRAAKILEK